MSKRKIQDCTPYKTRLKALACAAGCRLTSIGDIERLAGVNTNSTAERQSLWNQFRHLFAAPTQELFDAVMEHCAQIALRRIQIGELSLVKTY